MEGCRNPSEIFRSFRPDIVLIKRDTIYVLELTCCFETNSEKSRTFKEKYKYIERDCVRKFRNFEKMFIEITTLGLITKHIFNFKQLLKDSEVNYDRMIAKCIEVAIRASYIYIYIYIYIRRNKPWTYSNLLEFY